MSRIRMVNSVGEYVAGEEYDLDDETSDRFLALGYAEGRVAGVYTSQEWEQFAATQKESTQEVSV